MADRVCLGAVTGAHGVRGLVKVKTFTEVAEDIASYGPGENEAGDRQFTLELKGSAKGQLIVSIKGVGDRNAAEAMRGTRFYVARASLPEVEEGEFYHADLIGLRVEDPSGTEIGTVSGLYNFGAGDLIEVRTEEGREELMPFTKEVVPLVDLEGGRIVLDRPPEVVANAAEE